MTSVRHRWRAPIYSVTVSLVAVMSYWSSVVHGHKTGSPPHVCRSMVPGHGHAAQNSTAPYHVVANDGLLTSSGFRVELTASVPDGYFIGFLIEARVPGSDRNAVGSFQEWTPDEESVDTANFKTLNCNGVPKSGVTHNSIKKKKSMEFNWEPPENFDDQVHFVATVVLDYSTYWVDVTSNPVQVIRDTDPENSGLDLKIFFLDEELKSSFSYNDCGISKNCLGSPPGCVKRKDCLAVVSTQPCVKNICRFEMLAKNSQYVAFGLSDDMEMGGDGVVECVYQKNDISGNVNAYKSLNLPNKNQNSRVKDQMGVVMEKFQSTSNFIYCELMIESRFNIDRYSYDLENNEYFVLLAAGSSVRSSNVNFHDVVSISSSEKRKLGQLNSDTETDSFYKGCDVTKTCFGATGECLSSQDCSAVMSVKVEGSQYIFEMKAKNAAYVAVGLSDDQKMGGDSVMECVHENVGTNQINAYMSWNVPNQKNNKRLMNQNGLSLLESSYVDGTIYCRVVRNAITLIKNVDFDLVRNKYFLLLASGSSINEKGVTYHNLVFSSTAEASNLSEIKLLKTSSKFLVKLHGLFMILAWIGAASIGIIIARYYRQTWVGVTFCSKDFWFGWHRLLMMSTWFFTLAGSTFIFLEVGGWVTSKKSKNHALLGIVTTVIVFFQPIFAAFRPSPDSTKRQIFNKMHRLAGNAAHIFSILTILLASGLGKAELPGWTSWIVVVYVVFYICVHLILSIYGNSMVGSRVTRNTFPMNDVFHNEKTSSNYEKNDDAPNSEFRKFWLCIHVLITVLTTLSLVCLVVFSPI